MARLWKNNGLSIVLFVLFLVFWLGQTLTGWRDEVETQLQHHHAAPGLLEYVKSGSFVEATTENWESEFLQMFAYVVFTVFLYQRGSAESKDPDAADEVESDPQANALHHNSKKIQAESWCHCLYQHSLSLAFLTLFFISFVAHAVGGVESYNEERHLHGAAAMTLWEFMGHARFWFQSFQNWQSEFLAIWSMVVLSIFLRERGSPESKPVDASHRQTGA